MKASISETMRQFLTGTSRCRHVRTGGEVLFSDLLGSTLGTLGGEGYRPVSRTAFGDTEDAGAFFTGKPKVEGLGKKDVFVPIKCLVLKALAKLTFFITREK